MGNTRFDFVDRTSMHLFYDKLYTTRGKRPPLKALMLLTDLKVEDLPSFLSRRKKLSRAYNTNVTALGDGLYRVSLQRTLGLRDIRDEVIIDAECEGAWIVLTNAESYFVTHVLERFFEKLYPMISRLYFNYSQLRTLLQIIKEAYGGKATPTFFTIKRWKSKPAEQRIFPAKEGTEILWDEDVDEEIQRLLSDDFTVIVDKLDFEVRDEHNSMLLQAHITRKGLCKLKFGSFSAFYGNVVLKGIDFGIGCKAFYDKRERSIEKGIVKLHPLQIKYPLSFRSEQLNHFAKKIPNAYSSSIIHGGNPYFVANLCDYEDGSSFGITALGNVMTVTPVTRATPQAVWRLLNKIQEILGDGEISEVQMR
jgi:hypothetical protein